MRPRRAFRPTGDALEARWVASSLGAHHAPPPHHVHVHHATHSAASRAQAGADPSVTLVNLFPFAAGTTFVRTSPAGAITTTAVVNTPSFGAPSTFVSEVGPGFGVVFAPGASTTPGANTGPGGDLNGLVLFGGPGGTPGGSLNGLVVF
ncbi:MAG: hypothetical protein P4L84_20675 [Isosphaeraceae bacterium]|nr:hypothetical protein [Isosphaeraceae bacterium]